MQADTTCEYGRCGGKGVRKTNERARRIARQAVSIDGAISLVCESCLDLVLRDAARNGRRAAREPWPGLHDRPESSSEKAAADQILQQTNALADLLRNR